MAGFPPGLKMVGAGDPVEPGLLARDRLLDQFPGWYCSCMQPRK
jgi:hypothetical protein